ncbi:MAG: hypothetical protein IJK01_07520 [Clostridia bacterium]|nr:hypothetical protein [Clostridia bacterium]
MRTFKRILSQLHRYVFWAVISTMLWAWIFFVFVVDTTPKHKVEVYTSDSVIVLDREFSLELSKDPLPDGIRMVKVHPFSYAMFDTSAPIGADLYIVSESEIETTIEGLCPLPVRDGNDYVSNGEVYGWRIYDAAAKTGAASAYMRFALDENYYLCANATSLHLGSQNDSKDDAAIVIAERILSTP